MNTIDDYDAKNVACHILGIEQFEGEEENGMREEEHDEKVIDALYDKFGIEDLDVFADLLTKLAPMCFRTKSGLSESVQQGFAKVIEHTDDGKIGLEYLAKIDHLPNKEES